MHGLGNDFVVIDAVTQNVRMTGSMARRLADRKTGIGCDQVLVVEPPSDPQIDFNYRIFNCDGAEVEQCGNGARCLARFVHDRQLTGKTSIKVKTCNRVLSLNLIGKNQVEVDMGIPDLNPAALPFDAREKAMLYDIEVAGNNEKIFAVSMGNPHAVLTVDDIASAPVAQLGAALESHPRFANRVNVGFMQIIDKHNIRLRIYERGAGETMACGSGACAAVAAGILAGKLDYKVNVHLPAGQLIVEWLGGEQAIYLSGPAVHVFDGVVQL